MKILKALILLCLPITSFADVYFCEASHFALLGYDATSSTNVNTKFVVDTSEGESVIMGKFGEPVSS